MKLIVDSDLVSGLEVLPEPYATLAGGEKAIHDKAMQILAVYKDDIKVTRSTTHTYYSDVPNTAEVTTDDLTLIVAIGGDVEEYPAMFVVPDKTVAITGHTKTVDSGEVDVDGNPVYIEAPLTFADLETNTQKFIEVEGTFYIGTQALTGGHRYAKASELITIGHPFIRTKDFVALLPTEVI